jgi:uncharacterized protein YjbI with pentapeptide repeats
VSRPNSIDRKALTDRWKTKSGQALAGKAMARLVAGRRVDKLGLEQHDGRLDLRFLPAPFPRRLRRFETQGWFVEKLGGLVEFKRARLQNLDLSGAQLVSFRFHDSEIVDCRFEGANCQDWRLWGSQVSDCSFAKANLRDAAVGTRHEGRRNVWRRVDFSDADFRVGVSREAVYEDCDFAEAKLDKVQFEQCTLVRCRFAGELREVFFDGRDLSDRPAPPEMEGIDFSGATFREVEFRGFNLEGVVLPADPDIRLLRRARCVARRGLDLLGGDESREARMLRAILENWLRGPGTDDEAKVLNRRDYLEIGGPALLALVEDVISRAEAESLS